MLLNCFGINWTEVADWHCLRCVGLNTFHRPEDGQTVARSHWSYLVHTSPNTDILRATMYSGTAVLGSTDAKLSVT